jgi:arylsulfatase A-like enzyme
VAADHGSTELLGVLDPEILQSSGALFDWAHRIPMIFVWPKRIAPGRRFDQTVSMIDILPTVLDLVDLPLPEIYQGQSLAPLLLGDDGWKAQPTIIDEVYVADRETGDLSGGLEVIDGRWRAEMDVSTSSAGPPPEGAPPRLRLWDAWAPFRGSLEEDRPDLVEKYALILEETWRAHQVLGARFTRSGGALLTPEQLRTLRSLGYLQ